MSKRGQDGQTLRHTLETVKRMTGKTPDQLVNPHTLPEQLAHLWGWYLQISASRNYGASGAPLPVPETEIGAFFRNRQIVPDGWEFDAIRQLDSAVLDSE